MGGISNITNEESEVCEVSKRKYWRVFWMLVIVVIGLILFLPVKLITTEQGLPEPWFIGYSAFAVVSFSFLAVQIIKKRCVPGVPPSFLTNLPRDDEIDRRLPGDVDVELPPEDRELLYSIRELMEWFEEGKLTEARYRDYRARLAELERWLRTGIEKDIEIRNLRRELKKLREELERMKAARDEAGEAS
jgi:hypothetical protein